MHLFFLISRDPAGHFQHKSSNLSQSRVKQEQKGGNFDKTAITDLEQKGVRLKVIQAGSRYFNVGNIS